jgi:hypothetical protein
MMSIEGRGNAPALMRAYPFLKYVEWHTQAEEVSDFSKTLESLE